MKGALAMPDQKHIGSEGRIFIQVGLNEGKSFRHIASYLDKDPSSISKEVRRNRIFTAAGAAGRIPNKCIHRSDCSIRGLCGKNACTGYCRSCKKCNRVCPEFKKDCCPLLANPPYVCNGCKTSRTCVLDKYYYRASAAQKNYKQKLCDCRSGLSLTESELLCMDELITPLIKNNQSIHYICATQADKMLCSERTIYKIIDQGVLRVRNIDLLRKVSFRPRRKTKQFKVDKSCTIGRKYEDFLDFMKENPDIPVVEIDSVEGRKGGKVILTVFFRQSDLLLMFLRDHNTSQSVIDAFNFLDEILGREMFSRLFPVLLGDNGSEFSNPNAIESDISGQKRTIVFYCEPSSPYQKPHIERSHEFIRMVLPKGKSFDHLDQSDITRLACHINSYIRKKLNERHPISVFSFFHGDEILQKIGISAIPPGEVNLSPSLFAYKKDACIDEKDI